MSRLFGAIRQNGYVVRDIEAAMRHWTEVLGVGPFFFIEKPPLREFRYRGEPSAIELSIALANSGPLQIELIQQHNDAPSMYRDFLTGGHEGLQHVACWSEDFDAAVERAGKLGLQVGQSGQIGRRGRFVYFETSSHAGTVLELSEVDGPKGRFFDEVRRAAESWDGADPVRRIGTVPVRRV